MRNLLMRATAVGAVAALLLPSAAAFAHPRPVRGQLVDSAKVALLSAGQLKSVLSQYMWDTGQVRYGVTGYRLRYRTIDTKGRPIVASGLVVVPDGGPRKLPVVAYEHGTTAAKNAVASMTAGGGDREAAEFFAAAGYLTVAPDYLGLGTGDGLHPYMDSATEASATTDLLTAASGFARRHGHVPDGTLRVTGFSQGGAATMAVGRALRDGSWKVVALAPVSGPYDLRRVELPAAVANVGDGPGQVNPASATFYLAYWTVAANRAHHFYGDPSEVFQAPYDKTVEALFDGEHDEEAIVAALPASPAQLLTRQYAAKLLDPHGTLLAAIRAGDGTCDWRPPMPVRLYASDGDRDVPIANAGSCQAALAARGVTAPIVDAGDVDHTGSVIASLPKILTWFNALPG